MSGKTKFTPEGLSLMLRMFAEGESIADIYRYFVANNLPHPCISAIGCMTRYQHNQKQIEEFREAYNQRIMEIPIAHKRQRLDLRQMLVDELKKTIASMLKKHGGINLKNINKFNGLAKRLNEILNSAQEEMEKKPALVQMINLNANTTYEELSKYEKEIDAALISLRRKGLSLSNTGEGESSQDQETSS